MYVWSQEPSDELNYQVTGVGLVAVLVVLKKIETTLVGNVVRRFKKEVERILITLLSQIDIAEVDITTKVSLT